MRKILMLVAAVFMFLGVNLITTPTAEAGTCTSWACIKCLATGTYEKCTTPPPTPRPVIDDKG